MESPAPFDVYLPQSTMHGVCVDIGCVPHVIDGWTVRCLQDTLLSIEPVVRGTVLSPVFPGSWPGFPPNCMSSLCFPLQVVNVSKIAELAEEVSIGVDFSLF